MRYADVVSALAMLQESIGLVRWFLTYASFTGKRVVFACESYRTRKASMCGEAAGTANTCSLLFRGSVLIFNQRQTKSPTELLSDSMNASPLTRLPPELRNRIYELALTSEQPLRVLGSKHAANRDLCISLHQEQHNVVALMMTCNAIRSESAQLCCALNTFELTTSEQTVNLNLHDFAKAIGEANSRALRSLVLNIGESYGRSWNWTHKRVLPYLRSMICREFEDLASCKVVIRRRLLYWYYVPGKEVKESFDVDMDVDDFHGSLDTTEGELQRRLGIAELPEERRVLCDVIGQFRVLGGHLIKAQVWDLGK